MAKVTVKSPVVHDGEKYVAGDSIPDILQKDADRLVRLGVAVAGEVVTIKDDDPIVPPPQSGITPEQAAQIKKMKKSELVAALAKAGVKADDSELAADLKEKLTAAWSGASAGDDEDGELPPESLAEIAAMEREELIEALEVGNSDFSPDDSDDELRAKLKKAWADEVLTGD